jgi:anti-sigma regulatory factor (Ser/Thr protein kinase)
MDTQTRPTEFRSRPDPVLTQPTGPGVRNEISVEFEAGPDAAAAARNALRAVYGRVAPELLADVRLLVSELVTNSVRHSEIGPQDLVRVTVQVTANTIRVEVSDAGKGFAPQPRDLDRSRPGGWGLYLVDQLADRWGVMRNHITRVWFEIDRGPRLRA